MKACIPMHSFGFPCRIDEIVDICEQWNIVVIEDAAESLGSYYKKKHTGTFGKLGVFSFNGNKIVTAGGGGVIVTNDEGLAKRIKHLTTTAKIPHKWEYKHDELGFNYRMPNLNASLLCAQLENLSGFVSKKRELAANYEMFFKEIDINFVSEPEESKSNYWLNTLLLGDLEERNQFLDSLNSNNVMTRPAWELMNTLPMFKQSEKGSLTNAVYLADRIVNIPSSVIV
jgi:dTDP-4-amino-4,6-dideoxygalactose transaminase